MGPFVVSAALSCGLVSLLLLIEMPLNRTERRSAEQARLQILQRFRRNAVASAIFISLFILVIGYFLTLSTNARRGFFEDLADHFSEVWVAQTILGLVTGALLAIWMRRIYQAPARRRYLTLAQRVEGIALIVLFIVGTTSTPIADLFREASVDTGVFSFKLAAATNAAATAPQGNNWSPMALESGEPKITPVDEEIGVRTIAELAIAMDRDAHRIERYGSATAADVEAMLMPKGDRTAIRAQHEKLGVASARYTKYALPLAECVRALMEGTGDEEFGKALLARLKDGLAKLHYYSLTPRSMPEPGSQADFARRSKAIVASYARNIAGDFARTRTAASDMAKSFGTAASLKAAKACKLPEQTYSADDWEEIVRDRRPYLAIFYASVLQLIHQELVAIKVLDEWLQAYRKPVTPIDDEPAMQWFEFRVLTMRYQLYESLFRRDPKQSEILLAKHIDRMREFETFYRGLFPIQWLNSRMLPENEIDPVATAFRTVGEFVAACPADMAIDDLTIGWSLLNMRATLARRMILSSEFADKHQAIVDGLTTRILRTDLGCVQIHLPAPDVSRAQAEHLRVFVLYTLARLDGDHASQPAAATRRQMRLAESALRTALGLLAGDKQNVGSDLERELKKLLEGVQAQLRRKRT